MPMDSKDKEYQEKAKGLLKAEMVKKGLGYQELAAKLTELGIEESPKNLSNKVARGGFTAGFFIQCLEAMGVHVLRLQEPSS